MQDTDAAKGNFYLRTNAEIKTLKTKHTPNIIPFTKQHMRKKTHKNQTPKKNEYLTKLK